MSLPVKISNKKRIDDCFDTASGNYIIPHPIDDQYIVYFEQNTIAGSDNSSYGSIEGVIVELSSNKYDRFLDYKSILWEIATGKPRVFAILDNVYSKQHKHLMHLKEINGSIGRIKSMYFIYEYVSFWMPIVVENREERLRRKRLMH
jgi:hypothetical protein